MPALVPAVAALSYVVGLATVAVAPAIVAVVLVLTWPFDRNRAVAGRLLRLHAVLISRCFPFWRFRIEGRWPPGKQAYVVVSNHQSLLDIFLISNVPREMKWVAKKELFKIPWVGLAFKLAGDIPLERGEAASAATMLARARAYLARGMSVMIFPEGTRSRDGKLLPFKAGAFKLALEAGVPILPMAVSGSAQGMPKGSPWVRPARMIVRILEPVATQGLTVDDLAALRDDVRGRIARALGPEQEAEATRA